MLTNRKYEAGPQQLGWPWDLQNNELAWHRSNSHRKASFDLGDPLREAALQLGCRWLQTCGEDAIIQMEIKLKLN